MEEDGTYSIVGGTKTNICSEVHAETKAIAVLNRVLYFLQSDFFDLKRSSRNTLKF